MKQKNNMQSGSKTLKKAEFIEVKNNNKDSSVIEEIHGMLKNISYLKVHHSVEFSSCE